MDSKFLTKIMILCYRMQTFNTIFLLKHIFYTNSINNLNLYTFIVYILKLLCYNHKRNKGKLNYFNFPLLPVT